VPTLMQTKLPWYLNPFYPMFALGVGWLLGRVSHTASIPDRSGSTCSTVQRRWALSPVQRRSTMAAVVVGALGVAEGKLIWHSFNQRALEGSAQELLMQSADHLRGQVVHRGAWTRAETFVVRGIVEGEVAVSGSVEHFLATGSAQDFLLADGVLSDPRLVAVRSNGAHALFRRRD
jgi:hypothetical protein